MRAKVFFERTGLTFLLIALTFALSFGQKESPQDYFTDGIPFDVEVMISRTLDGHYVLFAFNPGQPDLDYFAARPKRFRVEWYNQKGALVSDRYFMISECGKKYRVFVKDKLLERRVSTICSTPVCHNPNSVTPGINSIVPKY